MLNPVIANASLTQGQLDAIKAHPDVRHLALEWASAMCERHIDHVGDFCAELWSAINEAAGIDVLAPTTEIPVSVTPMLVAADFNDEFVPDPDNYAQGAGDRQCYSVTECIVYILIDETKQVIELDPININDYC